MRNSKQVTESVNTIQVQQHYEGPLPHPEYLAQYDKIVPGAAERIIAMAEKEMNHRHEKDKSMYKNAIKTSYLSITFAFLSVLVISGIAFYAFYKNIGVVAGTIVAGSIAAVVGAFLYKNKQK